MYANEENWDDEPSAAPMQFVPQNNARYDTQHFEPSSSRKSYQSNTRGNRSNYQRNDSRGNNYERNMNGNGSRYDNSNSYRNYKGRNSYSGGRDRQNNDSNATIIKVPSKFVGRIIGKGGSKISDLQFESGAKIIVTKETEDDKTIIKIFGDANSAKRAQGLIDDLTVEKERPPPIDLGIKYCNGEEEPEQREFELIDWDAVYKKSDEYEAAEWAKVPPTKKEFYVEHPEIIEMSQKESDEFRLASNNIIVDRTFKKEDSKPIPKPIKSFYHAFHNYPEILNEIDKAGFQKPSPIQSQAWPILLSGEDLIGIAQTGTGKTLAFLLPALIHIDGQLTTRQERKGPAVLVMAPTRELALQIDKEVKKYEYKGVNAVCIYGGGNRREQIKICTQGVDIVIATPGRLNDLIDADHLDIRYVTYVVLDEADRMLDMGFEPQIRRVMYKIRPTRQTVMTSATWPIGVRRLAESYMVDPVQIYVGTLDLAATHTVSQVIEMLPDDDTEKYNFFMDFVTKLKPEDKIIVFCGKKARADHLSSELNLAGINCQSLHGDRDQSDREQALIDIADGTVRVLIATDVASRGLDIDDLTYVINYDFPRNIEEYVHRVGRTGRAGKSGTSISYFTKADWAQARELISILEEAKQFVPDAIYKMAERHDAWKQKKDAQKSGNQRGFGRSRFGANGGRRW